MVEPRSCRRRGTLVSPFRACGPVLAALAVETRLAGSPEYGGPHFQVAVAFPARSLARCRVVLAVQIPSIIQTSFTARPRLMGPSTPREQVKSASTMRSHSENSTCASSSGVSRPSTTSTFSSQAITPRTATYRCT